MAIWDIFLIAGVLFLAFSEKTVLRWAAPFPSRKDLDESNYPVLNWGDGHKAESLNMVYNHVINITKAAITWYMSAKKGKKFMAQRIRVAAIVLGALGALLPTIGELFSKSGQGSNIPAGWTTVCLAVTGTLLLLDRFFGYSSGWMRYIVTGTTLIDVLREFQVDWEIERSTWQQPEPTPDQVSKMLTVCKSYLVRVSALVKDETNSWVSEFQNSIKYLDETTKAKAEEKQPGSMNITIASPNPIQANWDLYVNGVQEKRSGTSIGKTNLLPGQYHIKVSATTSTGTVIGAEKVVTITAGGITNETLSLS
jgi:hypothetical protein